jgi:hypothetical protein
VSATPGSRQGQPPREGWGAWLQVAAAAAVLLMLSEALWLWQTWPVRDLLQPAVAQHTASRT